MSIYFKMLNESFDKLDESKQDEKNFETAFGAELKDRFLKQKPRMKSPQNDFYYWIGLKNEKGDEAVSELDQFISELENKQTRSQKRKMISEGAELVFEDENWEVLHILTYAAAAQYGSHTKWCITGRYPGYENDKDGEDFFNEYLEDGDNPHYKGYYFFIKKDGSDVKFAVCPRLEGGFSVFTPEDDDIGYVPNGPEIEGVLELEGLPVDKDSSRYDSYEGEEDDGWEEEGPAPEPVSRGFDLVPVQEPEQIVANSLEDALSHFGMESVGSLDNGMTIAKFKNEAGEDKFTIFIFQNGEASPLYTMTGPGQFARVDYESIEALQDFAARNMGAIRVQDNNHPENNDDIPADMGLNTEDDVDEELNESLLLLVDYDVLK